MDLSIIIISFDTKELLRECLTSVLNQTKGVEFEVIVVDNGSSDTSVEMVKKEFPQIKLIKNKENLGFAKANNQALRQSHGEYVLLLNSDTKIVNNALVKLVNFAESKKDLGIAGPRLLNLNDTPQPSAAPFYTLPVTAISLFSGDKFLRQSPSKSTPVDWVSGACFLIKREVIEKIGLLDERFFMYAEEMEFCYRAKKAGYQVYFYPQAEVIHLIQGGSSASWQGKQKAIWGIYRGLIHFYRKHFAPWKLFVLKFLLKAKAVGAWLLGVFTNNRYLKETYAKAYQLACHVKF